MGRFDPLYTRAQKDGAAEAVVDGERLYGRRIYPPEAVRMAAAGELQGLEAFAITLSTVRKEATRLRRERTGRQLNLKRERGTVEERLDATAAATLSIVEHALDRLGTRERSKGLTAKEIGELKAWALVQRELRARATPPSSHTGRGARAKDEEPAPATGNGKPARSPVMAAMEKDHRQAPRSHDTPPPTTGDTTNPPPAQPNEHGNGEVGGGA